MPDNRIVRFKAIVGLLLPIFLTSSMACSILPWKKSHSSYTREELARLSDKDIYVIDGEKYVKVPLEKDEKGDVKFTYVRVDRYLAGEVEPLSLEAERVKREEAKELKGVERKTDKEKEEVVAVQETEEKGTPPATTRRLNHPYLKRKIAILPFEDRTTFTFEKFGEVIADRLAKKMETEVFTSLVMDREMVRLNLEKLGLTPADLKDPAKTKLLNKALGVQGVIVGAVYGPFVTTATPVEDEKVSMAIVRINAKFIDPAEGRIVRDFVATNPLAGSEEFGVLSEEKAKYRAIDLAIDNIIAQVVDEINGMDWLTRIALVEGDTVYLNAGYQTGLKKGDLLEVYPAGDLKGVNPIGRIQVSRLFGIDASVAQVIQGRVQVDAVVKPLPQS
ncbi:MAG: hypothetical protein A2Y65_10505 [Deltaproteobacteria bacterium RBG_13_52_11]|nr:MAG: hypothetical protein A2Y65_10505 [Deltaproteobacteria bacterium RBG_13_52_11]